MIPHVLLYAGNDIPRDHRPPQPFKYKLCTCATSRHVKNSHTTDLHDGDITAWRIVASSPHIAVLEISQRHVIQTGLGGRICGNWVRTAETRALDDSVTGSGCIGTFQCDSMHTAQRGDIRARRFHWLSGKGVVGLRCRVLQRFGSC